MTHWGSLARSRFAPPERLDGLELVISNYAEQPHYAVDPGWPPQSPDLLEGAPSHHPSREALAAEAAQEAEKQAAELRRQQVLEEQVEIWRQNLAQLKALLKELKAVDRTRKRRRRGIFTVICPVCNADRGKRCTGTFNHAAHYERHQLAWLRKD